MTSKKTSKAKSGRGRKPVDEKKKIVQFSTYLTKTEGSTIVKKYGSLTQAIREEVLPKVS